MSGQHKIAWLCEALLVSRTGYYDWVKRRDKEKGRIIRYENRTRMLLPRSPIGCFADTETARAFL
jgi:hypothetical protein